MSCTEMYVVDSDGDVILHKEFSNSHRGAMMVWRQIAENMGFNVDFPFLVGDGIQKVWNIWKDNTAPLSHRIVMASTFDNVMVKRENLPNLIEAIEEYSKAFDPGHLLSQAATLRELTNDDQVAAICWNQTSVNCNPWMDDEGEPYNINSGLRHWFLFDALNGELKGKR